MSTNQPCALPDGKTPPIDTPDTAGAASTSGRGAALSRLEPWVDIAWVAVGSVLCFYAQRLGVWGPSGPDSGFFPLIAGALILAGGIVQLLGARRRRRVDDDPPFWDQAGASRRVLALLAGMVALILLVRYAGFIVASLAMMPFLLRQVEKRSWWYAAAVAVVATAAVHLLFGKLLGMPMPRGPLGF